MIKFAFKGGEPEAAQIDVIEQCLEGRTGVVDPHFLGEPLSGLSDGIVHSDQLNA